MRNELMTAWRDRTTQCLLLEDLEELGRFSGMAAAGSAPPAAAEIRVYKSNLAVLPSAAPPTQLRLAEVDSVRFDNASYSVIFESCGDRLVVSKLARKTDEFYRVSSFAMDALRKQSAEALHRIFQFLNPPQLQRVLTILGEGRSAPLSKLADIHPKLPQTLIARAVDEPLKPYFDALLSLAARDSVMAGYKFIREQRRGGCR